MGEDPIILPIDRVISEDVDGTRVKVDKRVYKLTKYNKRRQLSSTRSSRQLVQLIKVVKSSAVKLAVLVGCFLLLCAGFFGLIRSELSEQLRMQREYGEIGGVETLEDRGESVQLHEDELETIRRSIVEGLGLERIPDPSKANVSQAEYERANVEYLRRLQMLRAPGDRRRRRLHTFHATDEIDGLVNRTKRDASNQVDTHRLYFPLAIPSEDEEVDHATLRLILDSTGASDQVDVSIYRIGETSRHFVSSRTFWRTDGPRWIEMDVTDLAVLWHEGLVDNLGLEIQVDSEASLSQPVLNVFSTSSGQLRRRRAAPDHLMSLHKGRRTECRGDNKKCCRHEMTVTFKDLKGFEFIVQPKNFDAGYCKGRCPPRYNPAHHHALLQSLIWKEDRRKAPRPCCAPSKLAELEILYFDENDPTKLKVSSWKNMRVLECACS